MRRGAMTSTKDNQSQGNPRGTAGKRMLAVFVAMALSMVAAEAALRFLGLPAEYAPGRETLDPEWNRLIHRPSSIPGLDYELSPNLDRRMFGVRVRTNRFGMRGPEVGLEKPKGVFRIVALGDSITFGWKVEEEEAWPIQLAIMLNAAGVRAEALNLGVSGFNARDETTIFLQRGKDFDPDLVVLGYCLNDPEYEPVQPLSAFYRDPSWWQRSNLLRMAMKAARSVRVRAYGNGDYQLFLHRYPPAWTTVKNSFARLGMWSREHKVPALVIIFPDLSVPAADYPYAAIHEQVGDEARRDGLSVLDLRAVYDGRPRESMRIADDDAHPSSAGQRLAAEAVRDFILRQHPEWLRQP